jgi:hypothetical protein
MDVTIGVDIVDRHERGLFDLEVYRHILTRMIYRPVPPIEPYLYAGRWISREKARQQEKGPEAQEKEHDPCSVLKASHCIILLVSKGATMIALPLEKATVMPGGGDRHEKGMAYL